MERQRNPGTISGVVEGSMDCFKNLDSASLHPDYDCQAEDRARYWREQPCLVVEIGSASTARIDRREKFLAYREIPTLEDYRPLEQDTVGLIPFTRKAAWQPHPLGVEDTLHPKPRSGSPCR
jgi:Uma2 family endonuclease